MEDVVIGLEIHVQLNKLTSKLFCGCSTKFHDSEPNTHTCPVCLGLPGSLPVLNKKAVENAIKVGLALNCNIENDTIFYRKNYYYPDLPKGFQISQYDFPLATLGLISIKGDDGIERIINITRVHMEEDPGRLVHAGTIDKAKYTKVDYNRCGMSLLEVVTEPDIKSPKEARTLLDKLRSILEYLDVFDGNLEGAMRVDANISLSGGDRTEVKNISSFKGVEKALSYEITRQRNIRRRNMKVIQETRHYDEMRNITVSIRSKEEAHDYRYFPEPDLVVLRITDWVPIIKAQLPELPDAKRKRFKHQYGLSNDHAKSLTTDIRVADFYELVASKAPPKLAAVWIADVLKGELNYRNQTIEHFGPDYMIEIVNMLASNELTEDNAVEIIRTILDKGGTPAEIIKAKGLVKAEDDVVYKIVKETIAECSTAITDFKAGSPRALNYIVGQAMKKTRGRADPAMVHKMVREEVERL
ncbi:MAG: Asp-tRNA(Asn)/Glu-tRNA(Gln) amidotransferase subunit GatB [Methanotrichaceae archaeon]|nr:Asp-tRNA(Asn)/Glu-tRNA(Gln) amidotransferase subunit GatB [Methanotrichaceae archaeon]